MDESDFQYLWDKRHQVLYRVELSALYHQKRERFFEVCDKLAKAVAVIGGSAALAKIGSGYWIVYIAAAITVTSTCSLVFGFSDRARRHAELSRNFASLSRISWRVGNGILSRPIWQPGMPESGSWKQPSRPPWEIWCAFVRMSWRWRSDRMKTFTRLGFSATCWPT